MYGLADLLLTTTNHQYENTEKEEEIPKRLHVSNSPIFPSDSGTPISS